MVGHFQTRFEDARHSVDPQEVGKVLRLAAGADKPLIQGFAYAEGSETRKTVGEQGVAGSETGSHPLCDGLETRAWDWGAHGAQRVAVIAARSGGDERDLVLRVATDLLEKLRHGKSRLELDSIHRQVSTLRYDVI